MIIVSKLETNFNLDIAIVLLYLLIMEPKFTGLVLHEWIGLCVGIMFIIHILMHWQWIVEASKRYFKKFPKKAKLNYVLDILLLIGSGAILLSAFPISKKIGFAWLGIGGDISMWQHLHVAFSFLTLFVIAIHLGLHWKWTINALNKIGQFDIKRLSKPLKGSFILIVVIFGIYSFNYVDYFNTIKNNLVFEGQYIVQPKNTTFLDDNISKLNSITISSENENSKVKGARGGGGGRGSGSGYPSYTVTTDSTSILAYFGLSTLIILIVYYLEVLVNKIKRRKRILLIKPVNKTC